MSMQHTVSSSRVVAAAMADLSARLPELATQCANTAAQAVPELADPDLRPTLLASCEANIATMVAMLQAGQPVVRGRVPPDAFALARELVHFGAEPSLILKAYRAGHAWFQDVAVGVLTPRLTDAEELRVVLTPLSRWVFEYIDAVCDQLNDEYEAERRRWLPSAGAIRSAVIRAVLTSTEEDLDRASLSLSYELRRTHVALIAWAADPAHDVHAAIRDVVAGLTASRPLIHEVSPTTAWAWLAAETVPQLSVPAPGLWVAVGAPGAGAEGFRTSHAQALDARRVTELAGWAPQTTTHFAAIELVALNTVDLERARGFVRGQLGELAGAGRATQNLRETVLAVFEEESLTAAAQRLAVHPNTVVYRLRRAAEVLGRPVEQNRLQLQTALHLAKIIGLSQPDESPREGDGAQGVRA